MIQNYRSVWTELISDNCLFFRVLTDGSCFTVLKQIAEGAVAKQASAAVDWMEKRLAVSCDPYGAECNCP